MTSRQPDTTPPGTGGHAAIPAGSRHRLVPVPRWPALVPTLALLIIVGMAGLRTEVTGPRWDGPLHGDAVAVGIALEIVLGIMLVITVRRLGTRARAGTPNAAPPSLVAVQLRRVLAFVLGAGMIAVALTTFVGVRQHLFSGPPRAQPGQGVGGGGGGSSPVTRSGWHLAFAVHLHLHVTASLAYGLLILLFLGAVALRVWWVRQYGSSRSARAAYHYLAPDSKDLLEVVESGRWALRAVDDARAAIIACYVAMEASLAEHGAARAIADTPDELLTRATAMGLVRGTAAARLTALFYEARFSSHPLDRGQREAAGQALSELAAALAAEQEAGTQTGRRRANRTGARA
jgi:hypothetical protein